MRRIKCETDTSSGEWLRRAIRTFVQSAVGYIAVNLVGLCEGTGEITRRALGGVVCAAVAAGIAAVMNAPTRETAGKEDDDE